MAYQGTGHVFGPSVIPSNKTGVGPNPAATGISPTEWNQLEQFRADTATGQTAGDYHGLKDMAGGEPPVAPSGTVRRWASAGRSKVSQDGRQPRFEFHDRSLEEFGVVAGSTSDAVLNANTAGIQDALDWGLNEVIAGRASCITSIPGDVGINATLVWRGNSATSPAIVGPHPVGMSSDFGYSRFTWYGADGGLMMYGERTNCALMNGVSFNGRSVAGCLLQLAASLFASPTTLAAASGVRIKNCLFQKVKMATVGNACVKLGTDPAYTGGQTWQLSDARFDNCTFFAENAANGGDFAAMKAGGVKQLQGGNCKLFSYNYCQWGSCDIALDVYASSGPLNVFIAEMSNVRTAFKHASGALRVIGADIECSDVDDFRLLSGGTTVGGTAHLSGVECAAFMAGAVGTLVEYGGTATLSDCSLLRNLNHSVSGDPDVPNPYKMVVHSGANGTPGSFRSQRNWYHGAVGPYLPAYDGSGNDLAPIPHSAYGGENALRVSSQGDLGGCATVAHPAIQLADFDSADTTHYSAHYNGPVSFKHYTWSDTNASITIAAADNAQLLLVDATATGNRTVNLPTAVGRKGLWLKVKKVDASGHTVTLDPAGSETIDGASTKVLTAQWDSISIFSDGANWFIG